VTTAGIVKMIEPGIFQPFINQDALPYYQTVSLYEEDKEILWIGTVGSGLFRLQKSELTAYGEKTGLSEQTITGLCRDRDKNLWIGTEEGGLARMKDGLLGILPDAGGRAWGPVSAIYEDREGSLWVGTLDGGLNQFRDSKFISYSVREGLSHDNVNCVYEDRGGGIRIGTDGGLNYFKNGKLTTLSNPGQKLVLQVYEDRQDYLWIGTLTGLYRLKDGRLSTLTLKDGLSDNHISCLSEDRQGNTWVGTKNGLNRFNRDQGNFTVFTTKDGLTGNFITFIFEDSWGTLWIGTKNGLNCIKNGVLTVYNPAVNIEDKYFRCVYEDSRGVLWFGTHGGLIRLQKTGKGAALTTSYTTTSGLIENYVYSILEDELGYLWLAGRSGISRIEKKRLDDFAVGKIDQVHPRIYDEQDGMKSRWCTGGAYKSRDGRFWFPTIKGVALIDPNRSERYTPPPAIRIEKVVVDGAPLPTGVYAGRAIKPAELGPGKKRLEIYYTAVSFITPRKIEFRLRLAGLNKKWLQKGDLRKTIYTNLAPGHYTFNVTARNPDGVWNKQAASFSFYLKPYFYRRPLFYLVIIFMVLAALFFVYRYKRGLRRTGARPSPAEKSIKQELPPQPETTALSRAGKKFMQKLHDMIDTNISDPDFNVDQMCKKLKMSRPTLYRKIQGFSGENPTEFLRSYRLLKAAELLKNNFGTVLEVALETGFSSSAYFTKCFKKKFRQLPSEYREKNKNELQD
jgi:AraC-like DNA-binding protein